MNGSHAIGLWFLVVFVALSAAACEAVDHTVGEGPDVHTVTSWSATGSEAGTTTSGSVSVGGAGGSDSGAGGSVSGAVGSASWTSGGLFSDTGNWDDLQVPEGCTVVRGAYQVSADNDDSQCELEVECGGTPANSLCFAVDDYFECECQSASLVRAFHLTGVAMVDACPHTVAACLSYATLEAGPFECVPTVADVDEPDYCFSDVFCTREGVIGDATFSELQERVSECSLGPAGWTCGCDLPSPAFELRTATSTPQCRDAGAWCTGEGVELTGSRTCTLVSQGEGDGICGAEVGCQRTVTLSGQEATMYEDERVECQLVSGGLYQCRCDQERPYTQVAAEDLPSACATGVSLCERDGTNPMD